MNVVNILDHLYIVYRNSIPGDSLVPIKMTERTYLENKNEIELWKTDKKVKLILVSNEGDISNGDY